jgi:ribosomal-protein-serine acetyltransferase
VAQVDPLTIELPDELVGERVLLRPWDERDAHALWEAVDSTRASLAEYMPWVHEFRVPADAASTIRRLRSLWLTRAELIVGIFDKATGAVLGGSGLSRIDWQIRRFEIGYWLRDSVVGRGYATETVQVLTRFAFGQLDANRVELQMIPSNTRSRAIPERLGFVYEGRLRRSLPDVNGNAADREIFALIRDDYEQLPWSPP